MADFRSRFARHPDDLDDDEAELLAQALITDPTSRSWAALAGLDIPLGLWLQLRTTVLLSSLCGVPFELPVTTPPGPAQDIPVTDADRRHAEALLDGYGATTA